MSSWYGVKLSVSARDLIKSLKETIDYINNGNKLKNKPLNLSVSAAKLRENIRKAINEINASGKLNNTPIKLKVKLDINDAVKNLQKQLSSLTLKTGGTNINSTALSQSIKETTNSIKTEGAAVQAVNNLLREQQTLLLKSGDIKRVQTFGSAGNTITNTFLNGQQTTQTTTTDFARQQREADRAYAAYSRLDSIINKLQADFSDPNATKPIKEQSNINELNAALTETRSKIEAVKTASAESFSRIKTDADSAIESLKLLIRTRQSEEYAANILRAVDIPTAKAIQTNAFDELKSKINDSRIPLSELSTDLTELQRLLNKIIDRNSLTAYLNQLNIVESKFDSLKAKAKETSDFSKQIQSDINRLNKLTSGTIFNNNENSANVINLRAQIQALIEKYQALQAASANSSTPEQMATNIESLRALQTELDIIVKDTDLIKENLRNTRIDSRLQTQIANLNAHITEFVNKNGKALNIVNPLSGLTFGTALQNLQAALPNAQDVATFNEVNNQFVTLRANIQSAGVAGNTLFTEFTTKAKKFLSWFSVTYVFTKARMYFNKLFTTVYELDTALIDLKKTFKGTDEELNQFYYESNKLAKQLGVTTAEIIQQGAAWSRLSYSSMDAMETMAQMSSMFAAISPDMDVSAATDGLISIMKAFKIDPDNVLDGILSKVIVVGNTRATSNGEIVEMLQKSSAAMREANNTLEQTIALETAAVEITRDAASTGTAWKTISARLRGLDEETLQVSEDITELTGKFADFTKTANTPGGISLFTDENKTTYKSTYQIIKELSEIWDDLTDVQTARIEEVMGGKRQLQVVSAAISNFEAAENAMDSMANSAGNAQSEMDVIRESAEYLYNQLKETFTSITQHAVSQNDLKSLIKLGTSLLEIVDGIVSGIGSIPTLLGTIFGVIATKSKSLLGYNKTTDKFSLFGTTLEKGWFSNFKANQAEIKATANLVNELRTSFDGAAISQGMMNKVSASSSVALKELVNDFNSGKISSSQFTAGLNQMSAELKTTGSGVTALKTGLKSLGAAVGNIAISMGVAWLVSTAISTMVKAVDNAIHAVENLTKSAKENAETAKNSKTEIERLNDELATTKKRLEELEKIKLSRGLDLFEEDEYNNLKKYNDELERSINLETAKMELALQQANNDAKKAIKKTQTRWNMGMNMGGVNPDYEDWGISLTDIPLDVLNESLRLQMRSEQEAMMRTYKYMLEEYDKFEDKNSKEATKYKKRLDSLNSALMDSMSIIYQWQLSLNPDDPENAENLEYFKKLTRQYEVLRGTIAETFTDIWNQGKYTTVRDKLLDMARAGELTAEKFRELNNTDIDGIEDFKEELEEISETNTTRVVESIMNEVERLDKEANNAADSIDNFTDALEKLYETLDDVISKQEKLADAFKQIQLGAVLSAQEIYELIKEMPDLAQYVERTADGYTITAEGIRAISKENQKQAKDDAEKDLENIREQISLLEQRDELEKKRDELEKEMESSNGSIIAFKRWDNADIEYQKAVEACQGITDTLEELKSAEQAILVAQGVLDEVFDGFVSVDNYDDAKSKISDYNKDIQALDKAIQSLNEGTLLSYDEMVEIVEIAPELQDFFTEMQDGYTISADKIEEWRKKSFEARNEYIQGLIEQAKMELQAAEDAKKAAEVILNIQNKFGTAAEQFVAQIELEASEKRIKDILDIIEKYEALMGDIKSPDNGDSLSDELQNRIDYYKTILDAVSAVKDRYTEILDNEIDALEESKDALKDANDERQRELDLIEARNNLENAKKRKVYVYTEGEGFKQVQDKAAVKEAEEKYRDVITDIQIAEIDKAIAEKEKQKEALEQSVKDLLELEQNIQDSLAISQAMKAYGLTDPSQLLSLPESVKEGIINGLADATIQKDIEDNKENVEHIAVTLDDVLANLGSNKKMADLSPDILDNVKQAAYNNAVQGFVEAAKDMTESMINNTTNVNNPTLNQTNSIVINDATDPEKVGQEVSNYIKNLLTQYNNSLK